MSRRLTAYGIEVDGRAVVDLAETETGARLDAAADLGPDDLWHLSTLMRELAANARRRESDKLLAAWDREDRLLNTGFPAVTSPWG